MFRTESNIYRLSKEEVDDILSCKSDLIQCAYKGSHKELSQLIQKQGENIRLNEQTPKFRLSALNITVIKNDVDKMLVLLEAGANPNVCDKFLWTALHCAAAASNKIMYQHLLKYNAREDLENNRYGTPKQLLKMTTLEENTPEILPIKYLENGKLIELTQKHFKTLTGDDATYVDGMVVPPEYLYTYCRTTYQQDPVNQISGKEYRKRLVDVTNLYLAQTKVRLGVFTTKTIPKGSLIPYDGELLKYSLEKMDTTYLYGSVDDEMSIQSKKYRNVGPNINTGFPNMYIHIYKAINGCVSQVVCVASREIKPHEQLLNHYGAHLLDFKTYFELNMEGVLDYLKNDGINKSIEFL